MISTACRSLVFCILIFSFVGCSKNQVTSPDQIIGSGRLVSQQRSPGSFTGIQVVGTAKVSIRQDSVQTLTVQADDNIIDSVTTSSSAGLLLIGLRQGSYNSITVNITATMSTINRLECVGSADFQSTGSIQTPSIVCRIVGAGNIGLAGTATNETVEITGSGSIHNFNFISNRCAALISGAGNIEVNVTQQLDATITGTGNIVYMGTPSTVHPVITGIGTVKTKP